MRQALTLHPDSRCAAVDRIDVEVLRPRPGVLALRYIVSGRADGLRLPSLVAPERVDGLWRHSCFEAFVRAAVGEAYYEVNLAPSTQWAAYRFDGYRSGMVAADVMGVPRILGQADGAGYVLHAELSLGGLADLPADGPWRLGLAAVIEAADGSLSYWALAHPPGQADFHHPDGFVLDLEGAA
jgi:hypothetical protein